MELEFYLSINPSVLLCLLSFMVLGIILFLSIPKKESKKKKKK